MYPAIRRLLPFLTIFVIIVVMSTFMLISPRKSIYRPNTDDPAKIYLHACAGCHGEKGQGESFLYPNLADESLDSKEVREFILNGAVFMPSFESIEGDTLNKLVDYVVRKNFLN